MAPLTWPAETSALLRRCAYPPAGQSVVCAVSGGADSLAMLALAVAAGCEALAVHVDHGLRPTSGEDAEVVRAAARALGAHCQMVAVTVAPGPDLEARARAARYGALPEGVMVGHTADDQAETVLLNLLRGAGLDGLSGMRAAGGGRRAVLRPIIGLRRAETAGFVAALGLAAVTDPSNSELRFRRNRVRLELLPLLADIAQRDPVPLLVRTARALAEDAELLDALASGLDATDTAALRSAPKPLAKRALRAWLRTGQGPSTTLRRRPSSTAPGRSWPAR